MTDKPTGVFVRLPLSEDQLKNVDRLAQEISENNSENEWRFRRHYVAACEELIAAIGTPVTGRELPTAVFRARVHSEDNSYEWSYLKAPPSDQDASEYELEVERLLTHEQALALLAARDAEIARDSERLDWLDRACVHVYEPKQYFDGIGCGVCRVSHRPSEGRNLREAIDAAREVG